MAYTLQQNIGHNSNQRVVLSTGCLKLVIQCHRYDIQIVLDIYHSRFVCYSICGNFTYVPRPRICS